MPLAVLDLPGRQSLFLEVVGAVVGLVVWPVVCLVVGLVVGLVVVVVLLVPVPPSPPPPLPVPAAKVVAADALTRATLRTSAMTCFILLFSVRSVPDFWQRSRGSLCSAWGRPSHSRAGLRASWMLPWR